MQSRKQPFRTQQLLCYTHLRYARERENYSTKHRASPKLIFPPIPLLGIEASKHPVKNSRHSPRIVTTPLPLPSFHQPFALFVPLHPLPLVPLPSAISAGRAAMRATEKYFLSPCAPPVVCCMGMGVGTDGLPSPRWKGNQLLRIGGRIVEVGAHRTRIRSLWSYVHPPEGNGGEEREIFRFIGKKRIIHASRCCPARVCN